MLGLGLSIPQVAARGSRSLVAAIRSLFAANEPGVWYDPSDLSTLYQDAAGTTPVTAVEQPVGLMLDKSKGLVLGPELVTNLTVNAPWVDNGNGSYSKPVVGSGTATLAQPGNVLNAGDYALVKFRIDEISGGSANIYIGGTGPYPFYTIGDKQFIGLAGTSTITDLAIQASAGVSLTVSNISVRQLPGNHASQPTATSRPVLSARVNQYLATEMLATQNVTTLAAQYRLSFEGTGTITLSGTATGVYSAGSHLITCTAGTLTSAVSGSVTKADLRVANDGANLPPYQRVNTSTDYDTAGFPHYLRFDGVDDWLVTNTITPEIDKVQVFAGVRKLSNPIGGAILAETSTIATDNSGAFWVATTISSTINYGFRSGGTNRPTLASGGVTSPSTNILTGISDISGDSAILRVNSAQVAQNSTDQGTGNYLAYPLYIGRRGGTTLPFNGHLYSLIVRFGSNLPDATIEKLEKYINTKTRAY